MAEVRRAGGFAGILVRVNVTAERVGVSLTMSGRPSQFGIEGADRWQAA